MQSGIGCYSASPSEEARPGFKLGQLSWSLKNTWETKRKLRSLIKPYQPVVTSSPSHNKTTITGGNTPAIESHRNEQAGNNAFV